MPATAFLLSLLLSFHPAAQRAAHARPAAQEGTQGSDTPEPPAGSRLPDGQREPARVLGETVVTAFFESPAHEEPFSTATTTTQELRERFFRTTPEMLSETPGVMVQETSHGQGSPYLRGFTGFRNLFLIDGIRLNNSVFRDGPNQYWNTVDPHSIDRLELVKGPGAVLRGSDAIGGAVNALSRNPWTYGDGLRAGGLLHYAVSSAEESHVVRGEAAVSLGESWGLLVGGTGKEFGDFQGGRDAGTLRNTGYDEWDADAKLEGFLDPTTRLVVAYQRVQQHDVPRTHSTVFAEPFEGTSPGTDLRRDLDQDRELVYVQLHSEREGPFFDRASASVSWHRQEEVEDRVRGGGSRRLQGFDVGTLGFFANLSSPSPVGRLTYGLDYYRDDVDSFSSQNAIQGPVADDASYDLLGLFVQDEIEATDRLTVTLGGRFQHAAADARSVLDPNTSTRISIEDDWNALVGSARLVYKLTEEVWRLFAGVSQGFRAPNLSDLTRFDSARSNEIEVPSPGLDPERFLTYEAGVKAQEERFAGQASLFYTEIDDQIIRFPTGDMIAGESVVTKTNAGDGHVYGVEVEASWRFCDDWTLFGLGTFLEGEATTFPTSAQVPREEYLDRLMPLTGELGLRWRPEEAGPWAEAVGILADDADKLSTRDRADTQRIPPGGTPGYAVLHLRGGWRVHRKLELHLAVENVSDEDYRIHGSGQNRPGQSFLFGLTVHL